jgi:hypothetical protein
MDLTHDGRLLTILTLIDEYSLQRLAIVVDRSIKSDDVLHTLSNLFLIYWMPENIKSNNDPKLTARTVSKWLHRISVKTTFIEPSSPREYG